MSLPLKLINPKKNWKIGFQRGDREKRAYSVFCPSFTMTDHENRIPEYEYDSTDENAMLPVIWK